MAPAATANAPSGPPQDGSDPLVGLETFSSIMAPPAAATSTQTGRPRTGLVGWLADHLPKGIGLPQREWEVRHRAVVIFILAHAVGLAIFGLVRGFSPTYALGEGAAIAAAGILASLSTFSRKVRGGLAALGCVMSSAVLTQFWGGVIEAHFHFFVVVALISLYQDWVPFLLCVSFVLVEHGIIGTMLPGWVYNHQNALNHPWTWAGIHAVLLLGECIALVVVWHSNEKAREETVRILNSAGEGIVGVDPHGIVTFANPAATRMAGGVAAIQGRPLFQMLRGEDDRPVLGGLEGRSLEPFTFVCYFARRDNERIPVEVLCTPIEEHAGLEGAVLTLRDITERLRSERERMEAADRVRELDQLRTVSDMKSRFLNMAAHELNTPLTPIKVQMHMLRKRAEQPPLQQHQQSIVLLDRNFKRLTTLVQDLLDSTRLQSGNLPMHPQQTDLGPLLREVAATFAPAAAQRNVQLDLQAPDRLLLDADPDRVVQAITNLLTNSLKFTPDGGRVALVAREDVDGVRIEVLDTGIGMTQDQLSRLFMPFSQVHDAQIAGNPGSGLGLYITQGIATMHHGKLWAESDGPGRGSRFVMHLPLHPSGAQQAAA